ncbi:hypothetical protein [Sphingomonas sp. NIBR02145]|uniref:hypothetical protein n=1 Tax=Sphingomonas sp. NIBR02145 TaxID=3014784 RepID=UPI0022B385B6|nr:hypothetical protein [Sphingomonas sp. NIBR02145]WHU01502.1 hypothetical protein O3305_14995 [Sphingomonas sp. NIBR02145]
MKQLLGVVVGVAVGIGVILGLRWIGMHYAIPEDFMPGMNPSPQTITVGSWALGALAGGVAAVRIAGTPASGWIVALLAIGFALIHSLIAPHPLWMQFAAVAAPLLAGAIVSGIARPA